MGKRKKSGKIKSPSMNIVRTKDKHHIKPRCRFDEDEDVHTNNIVFLDINFHRNYHKVFGLLTPEEAISFIRIVMQPDKVWTKRKLHKLRNVIRYSGASKWRNDD